VRVFGFVDTNVLLHYRFFDQVDWTSVLGSEEVTLVFAPVILSELDEHKHAGSRREKARAQAVLKRLHVLNVSTNAVEVRAGVRVIALDAEPPDTLFAQHRLAPSVMDDRLLASVLDFREQPQAGRVVIVSADLGLLVKARSRQIEAVSPDDSLANPQELDETERKLASANTELAAMKTAAPDLRLTFGEGHVRQDWEVRPVSAFDENTVSRLKWDWEVRNRKISPTVSPTRFPDGTAVSVPNLVGMPGFVSDEDAASYNKNVDRLYKAYESFLRTVWPAAVNRQRRTIALALFLENVGTRPGEEVEVEISTDAAGVWLETPPELPKPPAVPRTRSPLEAISAHALMPNIDLGGLRTVGANVEGPEILNKRDQQTVRYDVRLAKHHVPCELPVVYFIFDSDGDVGSFNVDVRVFAANIPRPLTSRLDIKVTRVEPAAPPEPDLAIDEQPRHS
jgi:hypothetical protein